MNVVICLDDRYVLPFFALLDSLKCQESSARTALYVVGESLGESLTARIRESAAGRLAAVHFLQIAPDRIAHLPTQRWISRAAYLKLLAPGLLPPEAERAIVLDCDLLVRSDLQPLWQAGMADWLLLAVQDYGCPYVSCSFGIKRYRELSLASDAPYFNSGVMLIDLDRWRSENVAARGLEYLESHASDLRCHDQEALNVVASGRWGALDPRWNQMPHIHAAAALPDSPHREQLLAHRALLLSAPHIIHFAGRGKPWLPACTHPARPLFLRHLRSSGYLGMGGYLRWRLQLVRDSWRARTALAPAPTGSEDAAGGAPAASAPRYRALATRGISMGRQHMWLHSSRSGVARVVPAPVAQLLFGCDTFMTLDHHADRIARSAARNALRQPTRKGRSRLRQWISRFITRQLESAGAPVPVALETVLAYRRQLEDFVRDGFLVAERGLFIRLEERSDHAGATEDSSMAKVSVLGIPTRDRPELLRRALDSYARNLRHYGREVSVLIADDSRLPESIEANRATVDDVSRRFGMGITLVDRTWRADYAARIARASGVPLDIVSFALLGDERCDVTHGAARNTLQLLAAGRPQVQVDDDTICDIVRAKGESKPTGPGGTQFWFLPEEDDVCDAIEPADMDFIATHEAMLGASLRDLERWNAEGRLYVELGDLPSDRVDPADALGHSRHPGVGIGVTLGGGVGDSGLRNSWHRLFLSGPSFERLVYDPAAYRKRLATRRTVRIATAPTVTESPMGIGMNLGLDNRRLLPPFMPVGRMEDGIFLNILRRGAPFVWSGHLPHAIQHRPEGRQRQDALDFAVVGRGFLVNDCLEWLLDSAPGHGALGGVEPDYARLGRFLGEIAALPPGGFAEYLEHAAARWVARQVGLLERRLDMEHRLPPWWVGDVQRYMAALRFARSQPELVLPTDLTGEPGERIPIVQFIVAAYGSLLCHWSVLRRTAEDVPALKHHESRAKTAAASSP